MSTRPSAPDSPAPEQSSKWHYAALLGLVVTLTTIAYLPSLTGEFVWDDVLLIRDNPAIRNLSSARQAALGDFFRPPESLGTAQMELPQSGYFRPVPVLLNAATYQTFGADPLPFRLTNLALHILAILLVGLLYRRVGIRGTGAALGITIFALHPMNTEAVAFISGRTDLLAAVMCLATVLLYVRARNARTRLGAWAATLAVSVCFSLAVLSKEVALALPLVLLWFEVRGRTGQIGDRWNGHWAAAAAVMIIVGLAAGHRLMSDAGDVPRLYFELADAPVAAANLTTHYTRLLLLPFGHRALYDHLPVAQEGPLTFAGLAVWLATIAVLLPGRRWAPRLGLAMLWIAAFMVPVLHLVPIRALAAERYLYLPTIGLGLVAGALVHRVTASHSARAPLVVALVVGLTAGGFTMARALAWTDEISLWATEVGRPQASFKAFLNLGVALAERGRYAEALAAFREAWQRKPGHPAVFRNLVRLTLKLGPRDPQARGPGLSSDQRRAFWKDAVDPRPQADALLGWVGPLRAAGYRDLADVFDTMAEQLEAPPAPPSATSARQ